MDWLTQMLGGTGMTGGLGGLGGDVASPYGAGAFGGLGPGVGQMMMPAPPPVPGVNLPQGVEQMTPPIGASLEPQPAVTDQAQGGMASPADKFAKMLQGVKAPPAPDVVKPSTPAAPRLSPIRGGNDLIQMLMLLGAANPRAQQTGLGQQLRR